MQDIERSSELDPDNAYLFLHRGIYHFDKGEFQEALLLFQEAKKLDDTTYQIDDFIENAQDIIGTQN